MLDEDSDIEMMDKRLVSVVSNSGELESRARWINDELIQHKCVHIQIDNGIEFSHRSGNPPHFTQRAQSSIA